MNKYHTNKNGYDGFLMTCACNQYIEMIKYLANVLDMSSIKKKTYFCNNGFMLACAHNNIDIIKFLANDRNTLTFNKNVNGNNAFILACANKNTEVVNYIVDELKSNIYHIYNDGINGFINACIKRNIDVAILLIKKTMYK
jgi:ankyrin repeat protein